MLLAVVRVLLLGLWSYSVRVSVVETSVMVRRPTGLSVLLLLDWIKVRQIIETGRFGFIRESCRRFLAEMGRIVGRRTALNGRPA